MHKAAFALSLPMCRLRAAIISGLFLMQFVTVLPAFPQSYSLRPGDRLKLSIIEMPVDPLVSQIGIDGTVSFPYLGSFLAEGLTLNELQDQVSIDATGKVVTFYTVTGERLQVALDGTGVFLAIDAYRPVYLTGDVSSRGPVTYLPGMTIRTALASAGGASSLPIVFEQALMQAPDFRADVHSLATQHARAVVQLWGYDAILANDHDLAAPPWQSTLISQERFERFVTAERENVSFELEQFSRRKHFLEKQLQVLTDQIDRFGEQLTNQETVLRLENEKLVQVEELVDRGLTASNRLNDVRQGVLSIASSVLDAQSAMATLALRRDEVAQDLDTLEFRLLGEFRDRRSELAPQVLVLETNLRAAKQIMEMNGVAVEFDGLPDPVIEFTLTRASQQGGFETTSATLDQLLFPGDVIDVHLSNPAFTSILDMPPPDAQAVQ